MRERGWATARLDGIEPAGQGWIPIRSHFGIRAFGVNAWQADDGDAVIGEHDETQTGHEELYVVVAGHATFTLDGEEHDAPTGTVVFVRDPTVRRGAVARAAGTTILTAGAKPGEPYEPQPWEENARIIPLFATGEYERALEMLEDALERWPDQPTFLYNLACAEARLGRPDEAFLHLRLALEGQEALRDVARDDPDLEPLRDDPRFSAVAGEAQAGGAGA